MATNVTGATAFHTVPNLRASARLISERLLRMIARVCILAASAAPLSVDAAAGLLHPLTVEDILKVSNLGSGAARPGHDTFVWEQGPPYELTKDFGAGSVATSLSMNYRIMTLQPQTLRPIPLFAPAPRTLYRMIGFSDGGRFLLVYAIRSGRARLAAYDFDRRSLREYAITPRLPLVERFPDLAWLDDHRAVVAAYANDWGPFVLTYRRALGRRLSAAWEQTWMGRKPSVDVYESSSTDRPIPLPGRLAVVDFSAGAITDVAAGQYTALRPSRDGKLLVALRQFTVAQAAPDHPHLDGTYARSRLAVLSLEGKAVTLDPAPDLDVLPDSVVWNGSETQVVFFATRRGGLMLDGRFYIFDPHSDQLTDLNHDGLALASQRSRFGAAWPERPLWLEDSVAVLARATPGEPGTFPFQDAESKGVRDVRNPITTPAHWFLLRHASDPTDLTPNASQVAPVPMVRDGRRALLVVDGKIVSLTKDAPMTPAFPELTEPLETRANVTINAYTPDHGAGFVPVQGNSRRFVRVAPTAGGSRLQFLETASNTAVLAVSDSGDTLFLQGAGKGARLRIRRVAGSTVDLGELNPHLDEVEETRWIDFGYPGEPGSGREHLTGCLLLPPGYQPGRSYPMIVDVYPDLGGGCAAPERQFEAAMGAITDVNSDHLLAAHGYIVLRPDTGGGIAASSAGPQAKLAHIVDIGVDAALAHGFGDPNRLGLWGVSQGGFASLWVATQSSRYKAVASFNGWSDLVFHFFGMTRDEEYSRPEIPFFGGYDRYLSPAGGSFYMHGTPWDVPKAYLENSPLWRSNSVSAPVLLIHSDMDSFDDSGYKMFFSSLYFQRKDARLLLYRGEGHALSSPANVRNLWSNLYDWFDRYLGPAVGP